jgi:gliding motility-associated-like protein
MKIQNYKFLLLVLVSLFLSFYNASAQEVTIQEPVLATPISCAGVADGTLTVTIDTSGGGITPPFNYTIVRIFPATPLFTQQVSSNELSVTFTGLPQGTYVVAVEDVNLVSDDTQTLVANKNVVNTALNSSTNVLCFGAATGAFTVRGSGGLNTNYDFEITGPSFPSGSGFIGSGAKTQTFNNLLAGTYSVVARDENGCVDPTPLSVVITQATQIAISVSSKTDPLCAGNANGSISVSATGGTPGYQYSIDGVTFGNSNTFSGLTAGTYDISVRDNRGCVEILSGIVLTDPAVLAIALDSQTDIDGCFGDATGEIQVTASGGTAPYAYSINGGAFTSNGGLFTGLAAGTYTIVARDANGCTINLAPVTLTQPAQVAISLQSQTNVLGCFGDATGDITVVATGGQPAYEYSIDGGTTYQPSATFSGLTAGSYTILVRDTKGCTATLPNITITEPSQLDLVLSNSQNPLCNGDSNGSITVTASGGQPGYSYSVNGGTFQASNTFSGLPAGSYTVTVRDSKNCEAILPAIILNQPSILTLSVSSQQDVQNCFGDASGSITVAATGGTTAYEYSIDGGSTFQASPTFGSLTAGSYTILVRDANNCTTTVSTTINQPPVLALSLSSQTNILGCFGDATGSITVTATGGTPGYEYSRDGSTFQTSAIFNGLPAGSYTITVRDTRGCTATVAVTLTQPTQLTASLAAQTNILCFGQSTGSITVNATGGTGVLSYSIDGSTFGASGTFNGLTAGSYTVTVRDANGCTTTVPATLSQPTQLAGSITVQQNISCSGGTNGTITVSATGGTAPYTFSRDGVTFVSNSGSFTGLTAGSYTISVRDANNCTSTIGTVTLTEPTALQLTVSATTNVNCNGGNTGSVTVSATGGSSGYQYSIDGGSTFQASATFSGLTAGSYTITVRDANSCTTTVAATITQPAALVVNTSTTNVTCNGGTDGSATATVSGGTGSYTYSWNTSPVQTTATATGLAAGTYTVTVTDANGCQQTTGVTITQPALVAAPTASNPAAICTGGVIPTLTATGTNIQWYSDAALTTQVGTGNSFTPSISNATAGSFTFYATQTSGSCQSAATAVTITINPSPATPTISGTLTFCAGSNTILTSSSASGNQWLLNGSPISGATSQTLTVSTAGNYTVQVTSGSCSATSTVATVIQTTVPTPTIAGTLTFCAGGNTTLTSSATSGNQWLLNGSPIAGATNQTLTVTAAGNYSVAVTVSGCSATSAVATVTQTTVTAPVASNPAAICTGGVIPTLTATGTAIKWYSDAALTTQVGSGNSFTPSINNAVAGNTIFYATQTSGSCESAATAVTITINASPAKPTISGTLAFCSGSNTTLTSSAASGNQWLLNGSPIAGATNPTLVVSAAGNYSVQVTSNGCSATSDPVAVTVTSASAPVASNPAAICVGGTVPALTATGTNLQWYSDAALTTLVGTGSPFTPTVNTAVAGNTIFYVTQTVSGCPSTAAQVTVTVNPVPAKPTISGTLTFCTSGSTVLTSSATTGNQWLLNGTILTGETNQTLSVATAGNYSVVVTIGGCSATSDPVAVTETTPVTPTISGTLTFCPGDNTILTSSATSGNQWLLNGSPIAGATNQTLTVTAAGNYSVTVTTGGCSVTSAAVAVTQGAPVAPVASNPAAICTGGVIPTLTATGTNIQWYSDAALTTQVGTGNSFTPSISNATAGSFTFYATQTSGSCQSAATAVTITINPSPATPTISGTLTFCAGSNTILTSSSASGNQWLLNGSPISGATSQTLTVSTAGNYSVQITSNGCSATSASVTVTQSTLAATLATTNPGCSSPSSGVITITATGGTSPYSYSLDGTDFSNTSGVFGGLAAGNYTIYIKDAAGCIITRTQTLNAVSGITAATLTSANETDCSKADGTITVSGITGGTAPYEYYINGVANPAGINNNVFAGLTPASYVVRVVSANGCDFITTMVVGTNCVSCTLTASVGAQVNPTCKGNDGSITLTAANGTGTVSYSIDGGTNFNTNPVFSGLAAGSYTIVVKDASNCIVNAGTVTLTPAVAITATVTGSNPSTCGVNDGTITVSNVTGGSGTYQYSLDGVNYQTSNTFTGLAGNSYTVSIRDASNCVVTYTQVITAPNGISSVTVNTTSETSCSTVDGTITVTATGGTTPYKYYINGAPNPAGIGNNVFTGLAGGVYSIRVETANNCFFVTTASVGTNCTTPCTLLATTTVTDILCNNGSNGQIIVSASGGNGPYEYSLDGTNFQSTAIFTNLTPGVYTVTTREQNNPICKVTSSVTLTNPPAITGSVTASANPSCQNNDGSITVSASGGSGALQYALNGGTYTNSNSFTGLAAGSYTISAKDANGCITTIGSVTLTLPAAITASTSKTDPTTCSASDGQIIVSNVQNGTGPYQYAINGGSFQTSATFVGLAEGTYMIQVQDAAGCVASLTPVTLKVNVVLTATVASTNPTSCTAFDGTITVTNPTGGAAPYQYSIDGITFQASNVFTGLAENNYTVIIRDANGCTQSLPSVAITAPNSITAIALSATDETTCAANDGTIRVTSVTGGTAPYQYFINGVLNPAGANNATFSGLAGGIYTIKVVTADGCEFTSTTSVTIACCLQASISAKSDPTCQGNDGSITLASTGGSGTIQYSIDNGASFLTSANFTGLTAGTYTVIVKDDICQKPLGAVTLTTVPLTATVVSTDPSGCSATNGQIVISNVSGGTGSYTYSLDGVTYVATATFANLSSGSYTVFVQDASGCVISFNRTLASTGGILSVQTTTVAESNCNTRDGQITVVNVTGIAGPYEYYIDGVANPAGINTSTFTGLTSGPHTVRVVAPNTCDFTVSVVIGSNCTNTCTLTASISSQVDPTCAGNDGSISVNAANGTGTLQYSIDGGTTFVTTSVFTGLAAGNYTILVKDATGCQTSVSATLTLPATITATVTPTNPTGCNRSNGQISVDNASGGVGPYQYSIDGANYQTDSTFTALSDGSYTLYVKDANGCISSFTQVLSSPGGITATFASTDETACSANDGSITVTNVAGGTAPFRYFIDGLGNPAGINNNLFSGLSPGSYSIRVIASNGCRYTEVITIDAADCSNICQLTASASYKDPDCSSANSGSITVTPANGTAPYEYSVNGGAFATGTGTFNNLAAATYSIVVRDAKGCTFTVPTIQMMLPQGPNDLVAVVNNPSGCAAADATITIPNVAGGTVPYLYSIDGINFDAANQFTNLSAGTYTVYVRDAKMCVYSESVTITVPGGITATAATTDETACNADNGQIVVTVTGATGVVEYYINGAANPAGINSNAFTALAPGAYTILVKDAAGCQFTVATTVTAFTCPVCNLAATISNQVNPTCANNDGAITVNATNGTGTLQYSIDGGTTFVTTNVFTGLAAGNYTILVRDGAGCQTSVSATLTLPATITATITASNATSCTVGDGSIAISNVTGGAAPYQYSLDNVTFQAAASFTGLTAGSYTVFIKDAAGCSASFTQTITAPGGITATAITTNETACAANDGQVAVTVSGATGAVEYYINGVANPAGINSNAFVGLAPGTYTILVKDAAGCQFTTTATVTAFTCTGCTLTASAIEVQPTCANNDGAITVNATNGTGTLQYSIDGGTTFVTTNVFTGLAAGNYTILVRDGAGCQTSVSATLTLPATITATLTPTNPTSCNVTNGSIAVGSVVGGDGNYQYSLDGINYQSQPVFSGLSAGNYTVFIKDGANCSITISQLLTAPGGITATATVTNETACAANDGQVAVTVTGATGVVEYYINGAANPVGINNNTFTGLAPGTYSILVKDAADCEFVVTTTITVFTCTGCNLTASATQVQPTCAAPNGGSITVTPANGTAPYEYSVNGAAFAAGTGVFNTLTAGTYTIVVRDAKGCTFNVPAIVLNNPTLTLTVSTTNPTSCGVDDATLTATVSGGTAPYTYSLDGINFSGGSGVFTGLAAGSYTIFVQDAVGCVTNQSVTIATPGGITALTLNPTSETGCGKIDGTITVTGITGAVGPYEYYINGVANPAGINTNAFAGLAPATYTIRVVAANGCEFVSSTTIATVCTTCQLTATISDTDPTLCNTTDGTITIRNEVNGLAPYQYSIDGITFQSQPTFTGLADGSYTVVVKDANNCTYSQTVVLTAPIGFTATLVTTGETACKSNDGTITVSVNGGVAPYKYYINGVQNLAGNVFTALIPGTYTIRITDANNCEFTSVATVNTFTCPPPTCTLTASAFTNPVLCNGVNDGEAILINVSGGSGSYEYSIDNGKTYQANPMFTSLGAGNYTIFVRDKNDLTCFASFPVTVATKFNVAGIIIVNQPKSCGDKGTITFTNVFGGQAPYQFSIDGTIFASDTVFANLDPGTYKATIRDSKGCQFSASIQVIGGAAITATVAQGQQASCGKSDGTIVITNVSGGSGVFVYSLDGTTFSGSTTFANLAAGSYTVYIKEQNGSCVATFPAVVTAAECCKLALTPTATQPTGCASKDGSITINATDGVAPLTYRLNNGAAQNSNVFGGLGNGVYTILVTDANNCTATVTVTLTSPNAVTAQSEQVTPASCFGKADGAVRLINVTGGSGSYEYSIDGVTYQSSELFTGLKANTYLLYVRDKVSACVASYPVTVSEATQVTATVTPTNPSVCTTKDGRIVISNIAGGVGPYQVSMDSLTNYQLTPQFSNLGNGNYKIYIKDSRGCMAVYTLRLSSPNAVTAGNPTLINPTCQGSNNGEIRMTNVTGGQAPYEYNIDGGTYQSSGTFTALSAGKHIINVKDQSGCEYPFEYTLTEPATITFDVKQTKEATCTDPLGSVEVQNPVGGVLPYRYSLNNIDFQTSPIFENLTPGDYVMYVRDASRNTCASTKPFTIRGTQRVTYSITTANIGCSGTEKGSITIHTIRGGIESGAPVEYGISINGGKSYRYISSDSTVFDNLDAGLYDIIIEYGSGCRTDAQRVIINAGSIPFTVTTSAATCGTNNGSAEVVIANPIPGKTYYYSMDSLNFFTTPIFPNLYSGTYKMYVRESLTDQCPNIQAFTVPGPDSVRYVIRRQDCNTVIVDSIRGGVAPYVITISGRKAIVTGDIFANRYVFTDLPDGEYSLTIDDNAGCSTLPFNFRVGNRISYKVKTTPSIAEEPTGGVMVYDITGGQAPYEVSVDGQNWSVIKDKSIPIDTVVNGLPLGLLKVYVRDANGCMVVQDAEIRELKFVVPNVFTPNGDGVNDTFFITKLPAGTFVKIIDRWGRVVFETRDYKNEWDGGTYPDGIYYYTIDIAGEQTYKGWVQIWR